MTETFLKINSDCYDLQVYMFHLKKSLKDHLFEYIFELYGQTWKNSADISKKGASKSSS